MIEVTRDGTGFVMVPNWILELSPQAVKLYAVLWGYSDSKNRDAWPSRNTLAARMGFKQVRSIDPIIKELEEAGAITVRRAKDDKGINQPNRYHLHFERGSAVQSTTVVQYSARGSAVQSTEVVQSTAPEQEPLNKNQEQEGGLFQAPPAQPRTQTRATGYPDGFTVNNEMIAWARDKAPLAYRDINFESQKFEQHHRSKGSKFKDWTAAWRNWMLNADKWAREDMARLQQGRPQPVPDTGDWHKLGIDYNED